MKWDKPLPRHTKLDYYECYGKIVLEGLFPDKFINLKILDKPDLQSVCGNIGIEVTRAVRAEDIESERLYSELIYKQVKNEQKAIKRIEKNGSSICEYCLIGKPSNDTFDLIKKSFENKLNKINYGDYKEIKENYLFVFSEILANEPMLFDALETFIDMQRNMIKKFVEIFVLVPGELYRFKLNKNEFRIYKISSDEQRTHSNAARELVEINE